MMARNNFLFGHCVIVNNNFLLFVLENEEENGNRNAHEVRYKIVFLKKLFVLTKSNELVCKWLPLIFFQYTMEPKKDTKLYLWYCIRRATISLLMDNRWLLPCRSIVHFHTKRCENLPLRIYEITCGFHRFNGEFVKYIYIYI
jgi:hypothetical protein